MIAKNMSLFRQVAITVGLYVHLKSVRGSI